MTTLVARALWKKIRTNIWKSAVETGVIDNGSTKMAQPRWLTHAVVNWDVVWRRLFVNPLKTETTWIVRQPAVLLTHATRARLPPSASCCWPCVLSLAWHYWSKPRTSHIAVWCTHCMIRKKVIFEYEGQPELGTRPFFLLLFLVRNKFKLKREVVYT